MSPSSHTRGGGPPRRFWRTIILAFLTSLLVLFGPQSPVTAASGNTVAFASVRPSPPQTTPNLYNPRAGTQSLNRSYTPAPPGPEKPHAPQSIIRKPPMSTSGTLTAAQYQQSFSYDINGRMATGPQGNYTYCSSCHLDAVISTSNGYSAAYDAAGNKILLWKKPLDTLLVH